mmetsp:Transcript_55740/g.156998  ORF Transcript_55740/g.156998 Transcript_55740/m.156998 type:complete len:731 (-) Transcript_55740:74-2266(-)
MSKSSLTTDNVQRELRLAAEDVLHSALEDLSHRIRQDVRDEIRCCLPKREISRPSSPVQLESVRKPFPSTSEDGSVKAAGFAWPEIAKRSSSVILSDAESNFSPTPISPGRSKKHRDEGRPVDSPGRSRGEGHGNVDSPGHPRATWAQRPMEPPSPFPRPPTAVHTELLPCSVEPVLSETALSQDGRSPRMTNNWIFGEARQSHKLLKQGTTSIEAETLESSPRLDRLPSTLRLTKKGTQASTLARKSRAVTERSSCGSDWQPESMRGSEAPRKSTESTVRQPRDLKKKIIKESALGVYFDWGMTATIIVNGIFMGVQTDHMARSRSDMQPLSFDILEIIFCAIFTFELVLKLCKYRLDFFIMPDWRWNVFDFLLVLLQTVEVISLLNAMDSKNSSSGDAAAGASFSFLRLLRILRFFRTLRLIRLLEFFNELKLIVSSVVKSMRSLLWTLVLLGIMIYIVGIVFTQTVAQHRINHPERVDEDDLVQWWGTLPRSILSLYEAILGGVDWDDLVSPLMNHVHVLGAFIFSLYIAFATLAMMNVITSIFVESALKNAEKEKEEDFERMARLIFNMSDTDSSGEITRDEYFNQINDPEFQACARTMGINMQETAYLFNILDTNANNLINAEEMIKGLVHLRANATFMDIMSLKHDLELRAHQWEMELRTMRGSQKEMHNIMNRMTQVGKGGKRGSAMGLPNWLDLHDAQKDGRKAVVHKKNYDPDFGAYEEMV